MKNFIKILLLFTIFSCSKESLNKEDSQDIEYGLTDNIFIENHDFFKRDYVEKTYLEPSGNVENRENEVLIQRIIETFKTKYGNDKTINKLINKYGFPAWSLTFFALDQNEKEVRAFIPMYKSDKKTKGIVIADIKENDILYKILSQNKLKQKINKGDIHKELVSNASIVLSSNKRLGHDTNKKIYEYFNRNKSIINTRDYVLTVCAEQCIEYYSNTTGWTYSADDCITYGIVCTDYYLDTDSGSGSGSGNDYVDVYEPVSGGGGSSGSSNSSSYFENLDSRDLREHNKVIETYIDEHQLNFTLSEMQEIIDLTCYDLDIQAGILQEVSLNNVCVKNSIMEYQLNTLQDIIDNNPDAFLEDCIATGPIPDWTDLASFTPPSSVVQYLQSRDPSWFIQSISDANGPTINIDHIGVTFSNLPTGYTQESLFKEIQEDFLNFDTNCNSDFGYEFEKLDKPIWTSSDPVNTIFDIDIWGDDGTVITSQYSNTNCSCWTFSTVHSGSNEGNHPVSGNRQFGIKQNIDGTYTFYTRGVDRAYYNVLWGTNSGIGYYMADNLWDCIVVNIQSFVDPSGNNSYTFNESMRPDWEKIEEQLLTTPITDILDCVDNF